MATAAPSGRAYELVSPADHLAGAVPGLSTDLYPVPARSSDDGDRVLFGAGSTMGPNWSGPANPMIFARRTESGWSVRSAIRSVDRGNQIFGLGSHEPQSGWLTRDGKEFVFGSGQLGNVPDADPLFSGIYRSADALEPPTWLSAPTGTTDPAQGVNQTGVSAGNDTRTVVFRSTARLTDDAPPAGTQALYVHRDGELQLASIDVDGTPFTQRMNLANTVVDPTAASAQAISMRNEIAGNGRFVLMVDGDDNDWERSVYVRDLEAGVTRKLAGTGTGVPTATNLSASWTAPIGIFAGVALEKNTVPPGFVYGARDAGRAFFHPSLEVGDVPRVYDANLETGAVTERTAITGPPLGLSRDGEHMLFLAPPADATGGSSPAGDWTLRYWNAANPNTSTAVGTITTIATPGQNEAIARVYRVSDDGKTWIFTAAGSPDPGRPNTAPRTQQLYRWTVGESTPTCLTCQRTGGTVGAAGVSLTVQESIVSEHYLTPTMADVGPALNFAKTRIAQPGHSISDDGRWLLFDSPDRLVEEDTNDVRDVYLWDRDGGPNGKLELVTSGQGDTPSYALDLDPTGKNAFFSTREGLVSSDDDGKYDVYVARIGGGFPDDPPAECAGDECRERTIPDPPGVVVGSTRLGDVTSGAKVEVPRGTPALRIRSVRTAARRLTVRVDAPEPGRIRVSGKKVRTTTRTATRATTYTVRVPLSAATRRQVARGKRVRVTFRVQFTPKGSKKSTRVSSSVSVKKGR